MNASKLVSELIQSDDGMMGKCYGIMEETDEGLNIDVTDAVMAYCHGEENGRGFICERDAREAMAHYAQRSTSDKYRDITASEAMESGSVDEYRVYVKSVSSLGDEDCVLLYVKPGDTTEGVSVFAKASECSELVAIPFTLFSSSLNGTCSEEPDRPDFSLDPDECQ